MKKHRKLLALLVALTFLFSVAAPVMAAPAAEEKSAGTLNALGIIEGYEDGSFGLERDITRAEFAKIAVMAAGFGDAEGLMKNTPSKFSDVATGAWYTGWINLASAQGFVKGDPAGTFRPNDKITYAEVLTVLLRLVGYSDNLPGDWPMNYLTKAVQLGVTKGVSFDASAPAVRGSVFVLTEKVLEVPMVVWSKDKDVFEARKDANDNEIKLIANSFKGTMNEGLVTDLSWNNKGVASLKINKTTKTGFDPVTAVLAKNAVISGASDVVALLGNRVDYVLNDDGEITYAGVKATSTWTSPSGAASLDAAAGKVILGPPNTASMTYDLASDVVPADAVTYFPSKGALDMGRKMGPQLVGITPGQADKIVGVFDKKGNIEHVFVYNYSGADLIEEIDGNTIFGEVGTFKRGSSDQVVVIRNGVAASYFDLEEGDLIFVVEGADARGLKALIFASDAVKSGVVDEYTMSGSAVNSVTIDSVKYYLADGALISDDNGKEYNGDITKDTVDKKVDFMLSPGGKVGVFISDVKATSSDLYGIYQARDDGLEGKRIKIFTQEGKSVIYDATTAGYNGADGVVADTLVSYELNSRGQVSKVEVVGNVVFGNDIDGTRIQADGNWVRATSNTVIFRKAVDSGKLSVVDWDTAKNAVKNGSRSAEVDGNRILAVFYTGSGAGDETYGVIAGNGYNAGGYFYDVFVDGEKVRYNVVDGNTGKGKNAIVTFKLVDGKMGEVKVADKVYGGQVDKVGVDYVVINDISFDLSKDVMIVDVTGRDPVLATRVPRGANVDIYNVDDKGYHKLVIINK